MEPSSALSAFLLFLSMSLLQTSGQEMGLRGTVKSLSEKNYRIVITKNGWEKGEPAHPALTIKTFDKKGKLISNTMYAGENEVDVKILYEHGTHKTKVSTLTNEEELLEKMEIDRDTPQRHKFRQLDQNGNEKAVGFLFFDSGRLKKVTLNDATDATKHSMVVHHEYNEKGFTRAFKGEMKNGTTMSDITFNYPQTDEHGNWIERLTFNRGEKVPVIVTIRELEYYDSLTR